MPIAYRATYPAAPRVILDVLTDEDFLREYTGEVGVTRYTARVRTHDHTWSTELDMVVPTAGIPSIFKRIVGTEVPINDQRTWTGDGTGGFKSDLNVRGHAMGRTATIAGRLTLTSSTHGSDFAASGNVDLSIPLVGKQAREGIAALAEGVLKDETTVVHRWLTK